MYTVGFPLSTAFGFGIDNGVVELSGASIGNERLAIIGEPLNS